MKKVFKVIALVSATVLMCVSMCSCKQLDKMKKEHAKFTDKTFQTIEFNNTKYKKLNSTFQKVTDAFMYMNSPYNYITVTEKDVPVLLSGFFGKTAYCDEIGKRFIDIGSLGLYVKEDYFDKFSNDLKNDNFNNYAVKMLKITGNIILNPEETDAINYTIKNGEKVSRDDVDLDDIYLTVYRCNDDKVLVEEKLVIRSNLSDEYFFNMNEEFIKVPKEKWEIIKGIIEKSQAVEIPKTEAK